MKKSNRFFYASMAMMSILASPWAIADHSTGHFESKTLSLSLFENRWNPPGGASKGLLVVIHGLKDYGARYEALAEKANAAGFAVRAIDLPGHGVSPHWDGSTGKPDGYIENIDEVADAVSEYVSLLRKKSPELPVFVMGHSMGGTVVARAIERHNDTLATGVILSAPALELFSYQKLLAPGLKLLGSIAPMGPFFIGLDPVNFSNDPAVVESLESDPLVYSSIHPVATAAAIARADHKISNEAKAVTVPVLLIHSLADKVTNPEGSREFSESVSSTDKTLELLPADQKLKHDLLHEPNGAGERLQKMIIDWMKKRS